MTTSEEIKELENKLTENYSSEAKEIFKAMIEDKRRKLVPIILS
jgi:hypothetical protein